MPKSWSQSEIILRRFTTADASILAETWVSLLTIMPTTSNPTGWVEWRSAADTPIVRQRVYQTADATEPMWTPPASEDNTYETHNSSGVTWSTSDTATLLTGSQTILGVGVFITSSTSYSSGVPTSLVDLIYWNTLTTNLAVAQGESVTFLTGKIKVTESQNE